MQLHVQRQIDTRMVSWPAQRLTSNDRDGKKLYSSTATALWRSLGARAFRGAAPVPAGHIARVVVYFRQPPGRGQVRDASNFHPITKALVDGITHGPGGKRGTTKGPWPDDTAKFVLGQDERLLLPATGLQVIVQVWTAPRADH